MRTLLWIAFGLLLVLVIGFIVWLKPNASIPVISPPIPKVVQPLPALPAVTVDPPVIAYHWGVGQSDSAILPMPDPLMFPPVDAATSMAETREHGDPRTPPIDTTIAREKPTPTELDDSKGYARYEARQNAKLYKAYVASADKEIPALQSDIDRAKKEGFSPEQIKVVEEKVRRIQEMRDQLKVQHPDLYP